MNSYEQLLYLLIFMTVLYMLFFKKYRYLVLLFASIILVIFVSKFLSILMALSAGIVYIFAYLISKRTEEMKLKKENLSRDEYKSLKNKVQKHNKNLVVIGIILNIGLLVGLKYLNFFDSIFNKIFNICNFNLKIPYFNIILPLGVSYYTLSNTGYLIDVYRGKYKATKNYLDVLLFTCYFPCLLEGPISHYDRLLPQLKESHTFSFVNFKRGILIVLIGVFKKIVIADRLAIFVSSIFDGKTGPILLLGIIFFTIELYVEFSGIIDIVRGISLMYSIELEKNFDYPFFSSSVGEFWRRWHISLGTWFREYVFYPLSMSKPIMFLHKKIRGKVSIFLETFIPSMIVLFVVWTLTGLWHGASFKYLLYGLYYYVLILIEMIIDKVMPQSVSSKKVVKGIRIFITLILVNIGMLLFKCDTIKDFGLYIKNIFASPNVSFIEVFEIKELIVAILSIIILFVFELLLFKKIDIYKKLESLPIIIQYCCYIGLIFIIIIFGAYGMGYIPPDPIYGGF